jgi:hypothetical protein
MSHGRPTAEPAAALEGSLREGPPDERGYLAEAIDFSAAPGQARLNRQGRPPSARPVRRSRTVRAPFSLADALVVLLVIVVGGFAVLQRVGRVGLGTSPQPTSIESPGPSASPIPVPALRATFVSTRNGFSVRYPAGWVITPATTSWRPGTYVPIGNPALDELKQLGEARLVVASQRLAPGQTESQWLASYVQPYDLGACTGDRAGWQQLSVDGALGYLNIEACPLPADRAFSSPDLLFELIVVSGDRAYQIGLDGVVDQSYFEAILATIRLDPASALDPPEGS